ncbi:iron-containing alcohol dehydrogenase [Oscillatoria sp. FACHB-1407]|uniref:iron-containing alcohol dehydrogenase n=1 Tax=Oscillatoria sp. FACHB-1407 TaxID=2692847 RepID=UPI0016894D3F|nr:iron-containing alcohol dehydrogenase [Oscillatoria sp. FACHB-1407]MBD2462985.1 iron-containing alcohol dehydrogenase [Oscillatoria sp. FACHB-1407]
MGITEFSFPTAIRFGAGARHDIPTALQNKGIQRPLVVTDRGIVALPFFQALLQELTQAGLQPSVFSELGGNPVKSQVTAGVEAFRQQSADAIVALGGGAALDVAKAIALMVHHPGDLFDYEDGKPDGRAIDQPIPYVVAIPTTAGTGSEVGRSSVISDDETHAKKIIFSPRLLPQRVFADPELLLDLPPKITAATGMDALTHCVEAYLAKGYHPMCDGIAIEGVRLVAENLAKSVADGSDLEARSNMLMAAMMGAVAFQKGLGVTHSCAHALSTVYDLHHGLANALMIPYAMQFNLQAVPERLARLATVVGADEPTGAGFIAWLNALKAEVGIPNTLTEAGVAVDRLDQLVAIAFADGCHPLNPRPCTADDIRGIYTSAF